MIFEDLTGKRRKRAAAGVIVLALLGSLPFAAWRAGLEREPHLPGRGARAAALEPSESPPVTSVATRPGSKARTPTNIVFTAHDDPPGARTVDQHIEEIDVVVPDWFRVGGADCAIDETVDDASRRWAMRPDVRVAARVANLRGDHWSKAEAGALLHDETQRSCVARELARRATELGARGINIDFEALAPDDANGLVAFTSELRLRLGPDRLLTIDVTPDDPAYDLARLATVTDAIVLMAYDEHEETSDPGPIASAAWFAAVVDRARVHVPPEKLVVGLGAYCYDWGAGAEALDFQSAMDRAAAHAALPVFSGTTGGTTFRYDDGPQKHEVWCSDALALANQRSTLEAKGIHSWALWRAGAEDPSAWSVLRGDREALTDIAPPVGVRAVGTGDGWQMRAPRAGRRVIEWDADGRVREARYAAVPAGLTFERLGGSARREVALTFDDGPDPVGTPPILDALRAERAEATFFVLGEQAMGHPDLVERIAREGHLLGNHSFHHPHIDAIGEADLLRELRSTERVLEGIVGHYTPLFRAPYTAAFDAREPALLASHRPAFEAGYRVVGGDVDPADWERPGAQVIAERIVTQVEAGGRIVVLHDGGGDRTQTAEALRLALPRLRERGYNVVPLDRHLGLPRSAVAPPVDDSDRALAEGARVATFATSHGPLLLSILFTGSTAIAAIRVLMLVMLALRRRASAAPAPDYAPLTTILVPAYNEEKVLRATVTSLLTSTYRNIEVLVVDDGSTDGTYEIGRALAAEDPRVRCVTKRNAGKAAASNYGIQRARGEIIVCVDADTLITAEAVGLLVRHFADPAVSAVCGNVEVGNVRSILTAFQAIEYVTSQNLDRRALATLNAVNVVPGALGAWRRTELLAAGGYAHDTLVEDADLTLTVLARGGRIAYESKAIARTEAPETISALWKQRFRWTYGTYQCLAKHRRALFAGAMGMVALPNMILFQVLFPLLSPIGDAVMVAALFTGNTGAVLSGYLGFLAMDLLASAVAFKLDGKPLRWLPLLLVQRFTYRQLMYLVCLRAFLAALSGGRHGWRKLERTGSATLETATVTSLAAHHASKAPSKLAA